MEHLVERIQASNYLYFTEDELNPDSIRHNKSLYIAMQCKDVLIRKVLVDNDSALYVLPRHIFKEMHVDESHMKPSVMPHTFICDYSYFPTIWYVKIRVMFFPVLIYKSTVISTKILKESPLYRKVPSYRHIPCLHF